MRTSAALLAILGTTLALPIIPATNVTEPATSSPEPPKYHVYQSLWKRDTETVPERPCFGKGCLALWKREAEAEAKPEKECLGKACLALWKRKELIDPKSFNLKNVEGREAGDPKALILWKKEADAEAEKEKYKLWKKDAEADGEKYKLWRKDADAEAEPTIQGAWKREADAMEQKTKPKLWKKEAEADAVVTA